MQNLCADPEDRIWFESSLPLPETFLGINIYNFISTHKLLFQQTFHISLNTIAFHKYLHVFHLIVDVIKLYNSYYKIKKDGKDQEKLQSSTTPDPVYHMGK